MHIPNDNLIAIAYKTGYSGTLLYSIFCMSPETAKYNDLNPLEFHDGSAHENYEQWFNELHHYQNNNGITPESLQERMTEQVKKELAGHNLIFFRCHPDIALSMKFVDNLKVVYSSFKNTYIPERWAYEKLFKNNIQRLYNSSAELVLKLGNNSKLPRSRRIERHLICRQLNFQTAKPEDFSSSFAGRFYEVDMEKFLSGDYQQYIDVCKFLKLTPISNTEFQTIIQKYNNKQWKRF